MIAPPSYRSIVYQGVWTNNPALVQLLGLCPLLAVSGTVINALGLGLATMLTLLISNASVSLLRHWIRPEIRIPLYVLIIASVVSTIEHLMQAYFYELHTLLGIFIPLIVTNCLIIGRAEAFASRQPLPRALLDALAMGLGFTLALIALGAVRELIGQGTLLTQAHLLFGEKAKALSLIIFPDYPGFLLALLPPGAFIALGLLLALKNWLTASAHKT